MKSLNDSVKQYYRNGIINSRPLIVINGITFGYKSNSDTVKLLIKDDEGIKSFRIIKKEVSVKNILN